MRDKSHKYWRKKIATLKSEKTGLIALTTEEREEKRNFLISRKSIQVWPIVTCADLARGCRNFLTKYMEVPEDIADNLDFEALDRLPQGRRSKCHDEVLVRFKTAREKELVQSYAPNLASSNRRARLRMNVPQHLLGLFKMFEAHGGRLKQEHGPGLKRSIKLDDQTMTMVMDVRLPNDLEWLRLHRADIIRLTKERTEKESPFSYAAKPSSRSDKMRQLLLKSPLKKNTRVPVVSTSDDETDGAERERVRVNIGAESLSAA